MGIEGGRVRRSAVRTVRQINKEYFFHLTHKKEHIDARTFYAEIIVLLQKNPQNITLQMTGVVISAS